MRHGSGVVVAMIVSQIAPTTATKRIARTARMTNRTLRLARTAAFHWARCLNSAVTLAVEVVSLIVFVWPIKLDNVGWSGVVASPTSCIGRLKGGGISADGATGSGIEVALS